jgi:hypothetical protein
MIRLPKPLLAVPLILVLVAGCTNMAARGGDNYRVLPQSAYNTSP